jgi:hypothetical protein
MNHTATGRPPRMAAWLGYGGLIPFVILAAFTCLDRERSAFWIGNLRAYGAVILSFIGALHWGFSMMLTDVPVAQRNAMLAWSVVPCLIAFVSLVANSIVGDMLLASTFLFHWLVDLRVGALTGLPAWYLPMRLRLSCAAVVCLVTAAFAASW